MVQHQLLSYKRKVELWWLPDYVPEQQIQSQQGARCDRCHFLAEFCAVPTCHSVLSRGSCSAGTGLSVHNSEKLDLNIQRFTVVEVYEKPTSVIYWSV